MEPERKIEKLLRAYAKKRRAQSGESFKLHPATRQLLQGEVARDKPTPEDEDESVSLWELLRQRWAFLLSFAACIFLIGIILLPVTNSAKKKAAMVSTLNGLRQVGMAVQMAAKDYGGKLPATLDELATNGYLAQGALTDQESGKPFVYLGAGKNFESLSTNAVLAYSPTEKGERRAILLADGSTEMMNRDQFAEVTNSLALPPLARTVTPSAAPTLSGSIAAMPIEVSPAAPAPAFAPIAGGGGGASAPAATPPPPPIVASSDNVAPGQPNNIQQEEVPAIPAAAPAPAEMPPSQENSATLAARQQYQFTFAPAARQFMALQNTFKNSVASPQASPVLANFQVLQNGNAIRVVDQDGSVYEGSLQALEQRAPMAEGQSGVAVDQRLMQNAVKVATGLPVQKIAAAQDALQIAQTYFFRVYGTNRTINERVVFTGTFLPNLATAPKTQAPAPQAGFRGAVGGTIEEEKKLTTTNQPGQLPWSSLRITGTAIVNHTNQIQIDAAPVTPTKN